MPNTDLLTRLREVAGARYQTEEHLALGGYSFTPEQVQRGLERLQAILADPKYLGPKCPTCWAAMLDAFLEGAKDAV